MTNQEIFDKVAKHLLTQNNKCQASSGKCAYKNSYGLKCAVGCLIPDDKYDAVVEGAGVSAALKLEDTDYDENAKNSHEALRAILNDIGITKRNSRLLNSLQLVHDYFSPSEWKEELRAVARNYRLSPKVLKE